MKVPDRNGQIADVVLGFDKPDHLLGRSDAALLRRVVGRYGNRIAKGKFTLGGRTYTLATNNAPKRICTAATRASTSSCGRSRRRDGDGRIVGDLHAHEPRR